MSLERMTYLSYWSSDDPLTASTVVPGLAVLEELGVVGRTLITVERGGGRSTRAEVPHCTDHRPWEASRARPKLLARAIDILGSAWHVARTARASGSGWVLARGAVAGGIAHLAWRLGGPPYVVESYEPHGRYMVENGEWRPGGPMHRVQAWLERMQERHARFLLPVSHRFARELEERGVPADRILVVPCPVDLDRMAFDPEDRRQVRSRLGIPAEARVAIYVGKFGGLYLGPEAYRLFAMAMSGMGPDAHLIILSQTDAEVVRAGCGAAGMERARVHVDQVPHAEVPAYLSASDLAFATYRQTPSAAFLSPVKVGEYWANGLPVLLTRGVGDESGIIEQEPSGGAVIDPDGSDIAEAVEAVLARGRGPGPVRLARQHRSLDLVRAAYRTVLRGLDRRGDN